MGDIAESMLDGTCCAGCGEFLDDDPAGHPGYCSPQCAGASGAGGHYSPRTRDRRAEPAKDEHGATPKQRQALRRIVSNNGKRVGPFMARRLRDKGWVDNDGDLTAAGAAVIAVKRQAAPAQKAYAYNKASGEIELVEQRPGSRIFGAGAAP